MKQDIPIVGIDDGGFRIRHWRWTYVFAVFMRGSSYVENICQRKLELDSLTPSEVIIQLIRSCPQARNLKYILHKGVTIGGLGVIEPLKIYHEFGVPVVLIQERVVDRRLLMDTIKEKLGREEPVEVLRQLPEQHHDPDSGLYFQVMGAEPDEVRELISKSRGISKLPEALRIAHLIGKSYYHSVEKEG